jgi:putative sigma-54 modulation protein
MEITVSGRHVEVTPAIKTYASDKVSKLPRYFDRVHAINVVVDRNDSHSFNVEIIVTAEHHDKFVGKVSGEDMYACIDGAVDKLERQLTDFKEKSRTKKGRTPTAG